MEPRAPIQSALGPSGDGAPQRTLQEVSARAVGWMGRCDELLAQCTMSSSTLRRIALPNIHLYTTVPTPYPTCAQHRPFFISCLKCSMGGVKEGLVVELSNGGRAVVTATTGDDVILDANAMLAGQSVAMDLHLTHIVRPT